MKKILILGAGATQVPLIETSKKLGYETYVASIPGNYPGFAKADKVFYVNTTDKEGILDLAIREKIDGICTTGTDVAVRSIGYVNSKQNLSGISYESALKVTDKALMKKALVENGVRTAPFFRASSVEEVKNAALELGYPVMVKCTDQAASKGIIRIEHESEIEHAFKYALKNSRNSYVVVEKFLVGYEAGVDGYYSAESKCIIPHGKMTYTTGLTDVPSGHYIPFECSKELLEDIENQVELSCKACGLEKSFFNMDIMICNDLCYVIEIGGRTGATCIPDLISIYMGQSYYEKIIENCVGCVPLFDFSPKAYAIAELLVSDKTGVLMNADIEKCNSTEGIQCSLDISLGDVVNEFKVGTDRFGQMIVSAESRELALKKLDEAKQMLNLDISPIDKAVTIERLDETDEEDIVKYLKSIDSIFPVPMSSRVNIENHVKKLLSRGVVIVAKISGKIIGILLGYGNNHETKMGYLGTLGVSEGYRSLNIGKRLIDEFIVFLSENGMQGFGLHAHRDNTRALNFYQKNGCVLTSDDNKPYEESVYFTRLLSFPKENQGET